MKPNDKPPCWSDPKFRPVHGLLTRRDIEVAAMLACGHSNKEIAHRLVRRNGKGRLTTGTVKQYVKKLMDKLNIRSRGELMAWWWKNIERPINPLAGDCDKCILRAVHQLTEEIDKP